MFNMFESRSFAIDILMRKLESVRRSLINVTLYIVNIICNKAIRVSGVTLVDMSDRGRNEHYNKSAHVIGD